jgi:hypothetical protein
MATCLSVKADDVEKEIARLDINQDQVVRAPPRAAPPRRPAPDPPRRAAESDGRLNRHIMTRIARTQIRVGGHTAPPSLPSIAPARSDSEARRA